MKILISLNTAWNLVNFRAGLIRALVAQGHEVVAVAPYDSYAPRLAALGCRFVPLTMDNQGTHPGRDALLLWRFVRLLMRERPDVYLGYTVKPNVYGSLAARWLGIPVINNIAGLGAVFIKNGWLVRLVRWLYRMALRRSVKVFFQNDDDRQLFIAGGLVRAEVTDLLPGSGIDLQWFRPDPCRGGTLAAKSHARINSALQNQTQAPCRAEFIRALQDQTQAPCRAEFIRAPQNQTQAPCRAKFIRAPDACNFRFLLIARMLWDKGVAEYVEAARLIKTRWPHAECCLLGFVDVPNPAAISAAQMDAWMAQGFVNYLGVSDDVRIEIAAADCIVLPSYREGIPRTLLEAAAMGRPIITTDAVGCREVVDDGRNGYLCKVRDAGDLAAKMECMLSLSREQRSAMGLRGRQKMEAKFDEQIVIKKYLEAIRQLN